MLYSVCAICLLTSTKNKYIFVLIQTRFIINTQPHKNFKVLLFFALATVSFLFNACKKGSDSLINEAISGKQQARLIGEGNADNSLEDLLNSDNPMRDVVRYIKNGGRLPVTKHIKDYIHLIERNNITNEGDGSENYCSEGSFGIFVFRYPEKPCHDNGGATSRMNSNTGNERNNILDNCTCIDPISDHGIIKYMQWVDMAMMLRADNGIIYICG